jgi:putative toxin-antitoxin system antitoxin component (TIGR02293 family)
MLNSDDAVTARLLRIKAEAARVFADSAFARDWLFLPNPALNDRVPIKMAETDAGAREVEIILSRIAPGDYS